MKFDVKLHSRWKRIKSMSFTISQASEVNSKPEWVKIKAECSEM